IFWLYLMVLILLLGAELDAVLLHLVTTPTERASAAEQPESPPDSGKGVPRGTYTPPPASSSTDGGFRRILASILVVFILTATKTIFKLRPYAARLNAARRSPHA